MKAEIKRMTRYRLLVLLCAVLYSGSTYPQDEDTVTSKTILMSGKPLGVGGGPRNGFGVLNVCSAEKIGEKAVEVAVATAFDEMGLSLDPPTLDLLGALGIGKTWRTSASNVSSGLLSEYNTNARQPLPDGHRYYVSYKGKLTIEGRALTFTSVTSLNYGGKTSAESLPYNGDFDNRFFHKSLENLILKGIEIYGCR